MFTPFYSYSSFKLQLNSQLWGGLLWAPIVLCSYTISIYCTVFKLSLSPHRVYTLYIFWYRRRRRTRTRRIIKRTRVGGGGGSREQPRKVLNSPPPMDTASLQVHKEQFPIKKKKAWKLAKQLLHNKGQEVHTEMGKRGRDTVSPKTPPLVWRPTIGRDLKDTELFPEEQEFVPYIRHPNPWDLHWWDEPPKHLTLKTNRADVQKNQRAVRNGDSTLKGLACRLTHLAIQHKSHSLKSV